VCAKRKEFQIGHYCPKIIIFCNRTNTQLWATCTQSSTFKGRWWKRGRCL